MRAVIEIEFPSNEEDNLKPNALIEFFSDLDLSDFPNEIEFCSGVKIIDVPKFVESHLYVLRHSASERMLEETRRRLNQFYNIIIT